MIILYPLLLVLMAYITFVFGSYHKFKNNGIGLNFKYKVLILGLPMFIFYLHAKAAKKVFKQDRKRAWKILSLSIVKYPIMLGCLIELILESMVECDVYGDSKLLKVKRRKLKKIQSQRTPLFNVKELLTSFKKLKPYEDMLGKIYA
jgi:hypothetical protein